MIKTEMQQQTKKQTNQPLRNKYTKPQPIPNINISVVFQSTVLTATRISLRLRKYMP